MDARRARLEGLDKKLRGVSWYKYMDEAWGTEHRSHLSPLTTAYERVNEREDGHVDQRRPERGE